LLAPSFPKWRLKGVAQSPDYHPEGDVLVHTLACSNTGAPAETLALGALLHDIAKRAARSARHAHQLLRAL